MDHSSDEDFDFSDDDLEIEKDLRQNQDEPAAVKRPEKVVTGVKHLLELKETLALDLFKEKNSNKKERKKRQKERKRLQKKGLAGIVFNLTLSLCHINWIRGRSFACSWTKYGQNRFFWCEHLCSYISKKCKNFTQTII